MRSPRLLACHSIQREDRSFNPDIHQVRGSHTPPI
jgi:hypothetical protein